MTLRSARLRSCSGETIAMLTLAEMYSVERVGALGHRQQAVDHHAAVDAAGAQLDDLSAIKATSGEMTTVNAPVVACRDSAGIW